jgi:hypothetical protein
MKSKFIIFKDISTYITEILLKVLIKALPVRSATSFNTKHIDIISIIHERFMTYSSDVYLILHLIQFSEETGVPRENHQSNNIALSTHDWVGLRLWCLAQISTIFQLYRVSFLSFLYCAICFVYPRPVFCVLNVSSYSELSITEWLFAIL